MDVLAIRVGGVLSLTLGIFHVFFDAIFGWKQDLAKLYVVNAKVLYTVHVFLTPIFFFFAAISLGFSRELARGGGLATFVVGFYAAFWFARGVWQFVYFDPKQIPASRRELTLHYLVEAASIGFVVCYGYPLIHRV
jgi:hypothetical protein